MKAEPYTLYRELLQRSVGLARATVENALRSPKSPTAMFAAAALDTLLQQERETGLAASRRFLEVGNPALACAAGTAHGWFDFTKDDIDGSHVVAATRRHHDRHRRSGIALAREDVEDHVGRMDALGQRLDASLLHRKQSIGEGAGDPTAPSASADSGLVLVRGSDQRASGMSGRVGS